MQIICNRYNKDLTEFVQWRSCKVNFTAENSHFLLFSSSLSIITHFLAFARFITTLPRIVVRTNLQWNKIQMLLVAKTTFDIDTNKLSFSSYTHLIATYSTLDFGTTLIVLREREEFSFRESWITVDQNCFNLYHGKDTKFRYNKYALSPDKAHSDDTIKHALQSIRNHLLARRGAHEDSTSVLQDI